ncbi:MAG: RidA family protein, partial [Phycisphaerales bacterium]|nr:RidA family protein [Phycisphaerales bacterium]
AQCESCFANVKAVVEDAGAEWSDVFDVLAFLTHMDRDFAGYNEVYAKWFAGPDGPRPTRTTVEIGALPTPIAVELKVVCYRPGGPIKTARTGEAS